MISTLAMVFIGIMIGASLSEVHFMKKYKEYPALTRKMIIVLMIACFGVGALTITAYQLGHNDGRLERIAE